MATSSDDIAGLTRASIANLLFRVDMEHPIHPDIPWHCSCHAALGSHADPELAAHHRSHVAHEQADALLVVFAPSTQSETTT